MSIVLKVKFDPKRGGGTSYDLLSPALLVNNWADSVFTVLESTDDISYSTLTEGSDWRADVDWANSKLHLHILKDYSSIIYLAIASASVRNIGVGYSIQGDLGKLIPTAYNLESPSMTFISTAWNTGVLDRRNVPSGYPIKGDLGCRIPTGYTIKAISSRLVPVAYGISGAVSMLMNVSFHIGTSNQRMISSGVWIMGLASLPSETFIMPLNDDPAASRGKERTKEATLNGTTWEDLD